MNWPRSKHGRDEKYIETFRNKTRKQEKRPLGRPKRGWVDNIKIFLKEIWCKDTKWIYLAHDRD